jgi:hypothetical protein
LENATAPLVPGIPLFLRKGKMKFERKRKKKKLITQPADS